MAFSRTAYDLVHKRLIERWDQKPYWATQDVYDGVRMGLALWQALTGYWLSSITRDLIPSDNFLPTPGLEQALTVRRPDGRALIPTTIEELGFMRPTWRTDVPGTSGVPALPTYWAPIGQTTIVVWPYVTTLGYTLTLTGLGLTPQPQVHQGQTSIDLPDELVGILVDIAAWWGAGKAGTAEQDRHQPGLDRFLASVQEQGRLHGVADSHQVFLEAFRQRLASPTAPAEVES